MQIAEIIHCLEAFAPLALQEDYDNAGLITGNAEWECTGAIICLDATEAVVQEAREKNCNLVIAHHPVVFRGLKSIRTSSYTGQTLVAAIKQDIALYAIHTNLDNVAEGVNGVIASRLGLVNTHILQVKPGTLQKLQVYVPHQQAAELRNALFAAGAGHIGQYSECSFNTAGSGTFTAGAGTHPFVGEIGRRQQEEEIKIETVFPSWLQQKLVKAMKAAHPYEEVAYDILPLANAHEGRGAGIAGELDKAMSEKDFLARIKTIFQVPVIRHTRFTGRPVKKVALCGGAGSFLIPNAIASGAGVYITADMKYHEFFDAHGRLLVADVGHYESEQYTIALLAGILQEKFPTFAALKTGISTNPVHYFL